jgi:uncharacterized protein
MANVEAELRAKIGCLSRPATYGTGLLSVESIETHFAWVFLAGRFVYKMKKPLRFREFDLTTLPTRRANCELEVALNRRLAPTVYVGTVPLCSDRGQLSLAGCGTPVEWLVKMHRLPRERALHRLAATEELDETHLRALLEKLARFYATASRAPWDGRAYRRALKRDIECTATELAAPPLGLDAARVDCIAAELARRLEADAPAFHARVAAGRVVDTHGDLRPEHIFLLPEPQIIDCLEFSAELRLQDSAAEIAFLALECDRLGHAVVGERVIELYRRCSRDECGRDLLLFYRASRAFVRAKIAAWHLEDPLTADQQAHWRDRAHWYLDAAADAIGLDEARPLLARTDR